jgi:hypothetical protein
VLIHVYIYMYYTSVLFIYSLQIFGYDSLWYNCSIVIIIFYFFIFLVFPCFILLFVLVICAFFHTCMFLMELSLLIKNWNLNLYSVVPGCFAPITCSPRKVNLFRQFFGNHLFISCIQKNNSIKIK